MRNQTAKKIRQYVRREVVKQFQLLKAKPKWMPKFIYIFLARIIVDWDKLAKLSTTGINIDEKDG